MHRSVRKPDNWEASHRVGKGLGSVFVDFNANAGRIVDREMAALEGKIGLEHITDNGLMRHVFLDSEVVDSQVEVDCSRKRYR